MSFFVKVIAACMTFSFLFMGGGTATPSYLSNHSFFGSFFFPGGVCSFFYFWPVLVSSLLSGLLGLGFIFSRLSPFFLGQRKGRMVGNVISWPAVAVLVVYVV